MGKPEPFQNEIAKAIGVDVRTVRRWRDLDDYPTDATTVEQVVDWVKSKGLGQHKKQTRELAELKVLIAEQELEKKQRENQIARREIIPVEEASRAAARATAIWQLAIRAKLETEAPPRLAGKDIAELRAEIRTISDELCAEVSKIFDQEI
jgi:hypothetical protein